MNPPITSSPLRWIVRIILGQVAVRVLIFLAFLQALGHRRLDAEEHAVEAGLDHQVHQLAVVGQIDRRLGDEIDLRPAALRATRSARAATA